MHETLTFANNDQSERPGWGDRLSAVCSVGFELAIPVAVWLAAVMSALTVIGLGLRYVLWVAGVKP
jgi:hypothetical protein